MAEIKINPVFSPNKDSGGEEKKIIRIPAIGILSETEKQPGHYKDIFIEGIREVEGRKEFILSVEQEEGKFERLKQPRIKPERDEDLDRYYKALEEAQEKKSI